MHVERTIYMAKALRREVLPAFSRTWFYLQFVAVVAGAGSLVAAAVLG